MSRYRLLPTPTQEAMLRGHCGHARYVWNLAVEQHAHWRPGRPSAPGYLEQCGQLTQARAAHPWLAAGSQMVQQQALRDFAAAMAAFFDPRNPARRPTWRKAGRNEGFRIVGKRGARGTRQEPGRNVSQKAGLNRGILRSGWGLLVRRLAEKAPGRVEKINPAFTSQRCSACGQVDRKSRESQARFRCTACGYACHADVNAARNIAAGHAATARGGDGVTRPVNREPQLLLPSAW
jgi:transposase